MSVKMSNSGTAHLQHFKTVTSRLWRTAIVGLDGVSDEVSIDGPKEAFFFAIEHGRVFADHLRSEKEARIVSMLAEKSDLLRAVRRRPPEWDQHIDGARPLLWKALGLVDLEGRPYTTVGCEGDTGVHIACRVGDQHMVRFLMLRGCSVELRNAAGDLPMHIAAKLAMKCLEANPSFVAVHRDLHGLRANASQRHFASVKLPPPSANQHLRKEEAEPEAEELAPPPLFNLDKSPGASLGRRVAYRFLGAIEAVLNLAVETTHRREEGRKQSDHANWDELLACIMEKTSKAAVRELFESHIEFTFPSLILHTDLEAFKLAIQHSLERAIVDQLPTTNRPVAASHALERGNSSVLICSNLTMIEFRRVVVQSGTNSTYVALEIRPNRTLTGDALDTVNHAHAEAIRLVEKNGFRISFPHTQVPMDPDQPSTTAASTIELEAKPWRVDFLVPILSLHSALQVLPGHKHSVLHHSVLASLDAMREDVPGKPGYVNLFFTAMESDDNGFPPDHPSFDEYGRSPLQLIALTDNKEAIAHTTVRLYLRRRWRRYGGKLLMLSLLFYAIFLGLLSFCLFRAASLDDPLDYSSATDKFRAVMEIMILTYSLYTILRSALTLYLALYRGLQTPTGLAWYLLEFVEAGLTYSIMILRLCGASAEWPVASVTFLISTLKLFKFSVVFHGVGSLALIMYDVITSDLLVFSTLFLVLWWSFTGALHLILESSSRMLAPEVHSLPELALTNLRVLIEGEPSVGFDDFRSSSDTLGVVLLLVFWFLVIVLLLNVLIALLSETFARIQEDSIRELDLSRAKWLSRFDHVYLRVPWTRLAFGSLRRRFYRRWAQYHNPSQLLREWSLPDQLQTVVEHRMDNLEAQISKLAHSILRTTTLCIEVQKAVDTLTTSSDRDIAANKIRNLVRGFVERQLHGLQAPDGPGEDVERELAEAELLRAFSLFDRNGDGVLSPAEVRHLLTRLGSDRMSEEEAEAAIKLLDSNEDGVVDLIELSQTNVAFTRSVHPRLGLDGDGDEGSGSGHVGGGELRDRAAAMHLERLPSLAASRRLGAHHRMIPTNSTEELLDHEGVSISHV